MSNSRWFFQKYLTNPVACTRSFSRQKIGERQRPWRKHHSGVACSPRQALQKQRAATAVVPNSTRALHPTRQNTCEADTPNARGFVPSLARCMAFSPMHSRQTRATPVANLTRPLAFQYVVVARQKASTPVALGPLGRWSLLPHISDFGMLQFSLT